MPPMVDATIWQWPVTSFNPGDVNMYMFMLEQELPGKGKRDLRAAASARTADRMAADAAVRTRTVESSVIEAYAALRAAEREIAATRAAQPLAMELVQATEAAYASGRGTQASVVRAGLAETELSERLVMLQADADMRRVGLNARDGPRPLYADWCIWTTRSRAPSCRHCRCCSIAQATRIPSCSLHARESQKPKLAPAPRRPKGSPIGSCRAATC